MSIVTPIFNYLLAALRTLSPLGQPVFLGLLVASIVLGAFSTLLLILGLLATTAAVAIYTDPARRVPTGAGLILAPLDGYVTRTNDNAALPVAFDQAQEMSPIFRKLTLRSSFRLPRILRAPLTGTVREILRFTPDEAERAQERAWFEMDGAAVLIRDDENRECALVLHGAVIPKQILLTLQVGDKITAGDRIGLALFFVTADLYFPQTAPVLRDETHLVRAGETVLMAESFPHKPNYHHV